MSRHNFFVTCPKNLEDLLADELQKLAISDFKKTVAGVYFTGTLKDAYRVCLWSRLANRVLLFLARFPARTAEELYVNVKKVDWLQHLSPAHTLLIEFIGESPSFKNSLFGAQKVKDAIVDYMRARTGTRPNIEKINPDIRIHAYLHHDEVRLSLDLAGASLHQRGYRRFAGEAPLKENLAAALLYRANWPELAKQNTPLLDPFCGSGTILIEAVSMAARIAPGFLRTQFGFSRWLQFDSKVWQELKDAAEEERLHDLTKLPRIQGSDITLDVINKAKANVTRAGFSKAIHLEQQDARHIKSPFPTPGLMLANLPYGERIQTEDLQQLYQDFGNHIKAEFSGWQLGFLVGDLEMAKNLFLRAHKVYHFFNGKIPCELLLFKIF